MRIRNQVRFLTAYSAIVTVAFAVSAFHAAWRPRHNDGGVARFDRVVAHRIDIQEPNGLPRMIISDRSEFPGEYFDGKELSRPDRADSAGMLFMDDEGSEDGGLIYGGGKRNGQPYSFGHLSFDQYDQDQTIDLGSQLRDGVRTSGFSLNDMPMQAITPQLVTEAERIKQMPHGEARAVAWSRFQRDYPAGKERAAIERRPDGSVALTLRDQEGRSRLVLSVAGNGAPVIQFLDEGGKVLRTVGTETIKNEGVSHP